MDHVTVEHFGDRTSDELLETVASNCKTVPTAPSGATRSDSQAGNERNAAVGDSHGARPRGASRRCERHRADLRTGVRRAQLRLSSRTGCKDALRRVDELLKAGYVRGGRRSEELLRHDPARPPDGSPEGADRRQPRAEADRIVPEGRHPGRLAGRPKPARRKARCSVRC